MDEYEISKLKYKRKNNGKNKSIRDTQDALKVHNCNLSRIRENGAYTIFEEKVAERFLIILKIIF